MELTLIASIWCDTFLTVLLASSSMGQPYHKVCSWGKCTFWRQLSQESPESWCVATSEVGLPGLETGLFPCLDSIVLPYSPELSWLNCLDSIVIMCRQSAVINTFGAACAKLPCFRSYPRTSFCRVHGLSMKHSDITASPTTTGPWNSVRGHLSSIFKCWVGR